MRIYINYAIDSVTKRHLQLDSLATTYSHNPNPNFSAKMCPAILNILS
jgi:hypothetical protein